MNNQTPSQQASALSIPNVRLFILFKVLFNSRFYYPVFTILFLDFGLTIAQFSMLNAVWAATIVLAEVPLGALADIIGRKKLLNCATLIMIFEIGIICFIPTTNPTLVFYAFLFNRILSGLAEAAASGADEAIAYDSLVAQGDPDQWGRVLELLTRFQSIGFILAMSIGAAVYDPQLMERLLNSIGIPSTLTQETCMRFPLYLTFILSIGSFITTLKMADPILDSSTTKETITIGRAFKQTLSAGTWIFKTPFALCVILFGMLFDGIIRMVITLSSQYYRVIELPESIFGIIGSMVAMLGFFIPKIAKKTAENHSSSYPLMITSVLTFIGLCSMTFFWPYLGLIPALITFSAMYFNGFFISFYINKVTSSDQRATVLSFKGLAYNISYGLLGMVYAAGLKFEKQNGSAHLSQDTVFMDTFFWFPSVFCVWLVLLLIFSFVYLKKENRLF